MPTAGTKAEALRWAIYARYSSDRQSPTSIEDQVRLCRARVEREGGTLAEVYSDAALSGSTRRRPGLEALLADARDGRLDVVLAEALDRLSRDQEDVAHVAKRLAHAGVRLLTLEEGEIGALHIGLKGTMNALYLEALGRKSWRGLSGRVAAGKSAGGLGYGYRVVRRLDAAGELVTGELEIDEDQAAVVREVFRRYAAGESAKAIAHDLNRRGVPTARSGQAGGAWSPSAIVGNAGRGTGLLNNRLYVGERVWNRVRMVRDPDSGKRVSRLNPESDWQRAPAPELAIVEPALFEAARARKAAAAGAPLPKRRRPKRVFAGLVACACCDGPMTVVNRGRYGCRNARERGTCDNGRTIAAEELERRVLDALRDQLLAPEFAEAFVASYQAERRALAAESARQARRDDKRLADLARAIGHLVDRICDGTDTPETNRRLRELEDEKARLEAERGSAPDPDKVARIYPDLSRRWRRLVEDLAGALAQGAEGDRQAIELVRSVTTKIVVSPGRLRRPGKAGASADPCGVELHGSLATLLALAGGAVAGTAPASPNRAAPGWAAPNSRVMMVAGEGLEPPTRGL